MCSIHFWTGHECDGFHFPAFASSVQAAVVMGTAGWVHVLLGAGAYSVGSRLSLA